MTGGIAKDVRVCVCWGGWRGSGSRKSRSKEELGNSAPGHHHHMKNTRAFYSVLSPPNFKALEFLSPITWEDVWLRQQMSNTKVSRDEVKEAIWKWAHRGRNYILHLALWPKTGCNFSNHGSYSFTQVAAERLSHNAVHFPHHLMLGLPDIVFPKRQIYRLFMMYKRQGFLKKSHF